MVIREDHCPKLAQHLLPDHTEIQLTCSKPSYSCEQDSLSDTPSIGSSEDSDARGTWTGKLDFILSCIGYAVGLGNIWRFPYLCYRNGGGAFLIPYFLFLVICGMPLFMLELCFGQFGSLGPISIWRICPLFKGLGYGMAIIAGIVVIYYNVIIAWTIYYLYLSMNSVLPWSSCNNTWNTDQCTKDGWQHQNLAQNLVDNVTQFDEDSSINSTIAYTSATTIGYNVTEMTNLTGMTNLTEAIKTTSSQEFWSNYVLQISSGIEEPGSIRSELLICLVLAWILVFFCLFRGVKTSGKVVYFSATFPYLVLVILLIRGVTLPGAWEGIVFYLTPKWEKLTHFKVWGEAATQIFYSVGMGWGSILTFASYNRFHHNCYRDAIVVPIINCGTSVFAGFVVFSIIGFMAHETNTPIEEVVSQGPGLVFIVYPEAVAKLPISPFWALLFFSMIFTIGLDSQFGMFECVVSSFVDEFAVLRRHKLLATGCLAVFMFVLGIPCVTNGGVYVLQLMDWYASAFSLMVISIFETVVICWIYGVDRFIEDIRMMVNVTPNRFFVVCWTVITPVTIVGILLFTFINHTPVSYNSYPYPDWAIVVGWMLALASIVPIPLVAAIQLTKAKGTFKQRLYSCLAPSPEWGPYKVEQRIAYKKSLEGVPTRYRQRYVADLVHPEREINTEMAYK